MDVPLNEQAKVYYTSYHYRSDPNVHIVIYNITLPVTIVQNDVQRQLHLEKYLVSNYENGLKIVALLIIQPNSISKHNFT